jgi:hypothetical protein
MLPFLCPRPFNFTNLEAYNIEWGKEETGNYRFCKNIIGQAHAVHNVFFRDCIANAHVQMLSINAGAQMELIDIVKSGSSIAVNGIIRQRLVA